MNKNSNNGLQFLIGALLLLVGLFAGAFFLSEEKIKEIEVPGETPEPQIVYENVTVEVASAEKFRENALADFLEEVEDEDLATKCNGNRYGTDDIVVDKVFEEYSVEFGDLDDQEVTVNFKVRLEYDEEDVRSCRKTHNVEVFYEEDEDPVVTI